MAQSTTRFLVRSCLSFVGASLLSSSSALATVHYQTGFESPAFGLGPLIGQDNWIGDPSVNPAITVQAGTVASGSQAVRINAADDVGNFHWAWHPLSSVTSVATTAEPVVTVSWDMCLSDLGQGDVSTKLWGVDLYNGTDRIAVVGVFQDLNGPVVAGTGADGGTLFDFGPAPARGVWNSFKVVLNYDAQTYDVILNGTTLDSAAFNLGADATNDRTLGDADFTGQLLGNDSAYFDNFSVTSSPIPEPVMATPLLSVTLLLGRRRHEIASQFR